MPARAGHPRPPRATTPSGRAVPARLRCESPRDGSGHAARPMETSNTRESNLAALARLLPALRPLRAGRIAIMQHGVLRGTVRDQSMAGAFAELNQLGDRDVDWFAFAIPANEENESR